MLYQDVVGRACQIHWGKDWEGGVVVAVRQNAYDPPFVTVELADGTLRELPITGVRLLPKKDELSK
jgi:hypothetical protein